MSRLNRGWRAGWGVAAHFLPRHKAASSGISVNVIISHYAPSKLMCRLFDRLHLHRCSSPALFAYLTTLSSLTLYNIQPRGTIICDHHHYQHHHYHHHQQQRGTSFSFFSAPSSWLLVCPSLPWSNHVSAVGRSIFIH